jgi:glycosyltransferase involved in cell wall biosynthesis
MRIAWLSDYDLQGSGYLNISVPLCKELTKRGHLIKAAGIGYKGQEHNYNFSIIPAQNLRESYAIINNLSRLWGIDALVVALDIPLQELVLRQLQNRKYKYIGIMPIESTPMYISWAMTLLSMDKAMIISEFGVNEAKRLGIDATYIPIGIDAISWRPPTPDEKKALKKYFGFSENTFVVLTVADNQERKNLDAAMRMFSGFASGKDAKYILVTRPQNSVGWKLSELAQEYGISDKIMIFERGIPFKELWSIYACADAFLLSSKAEGYGLPLMEAMSVGIPCLATNSTGMKELLSDGRGILIDSKYNEYRDPFGGGYRYFASIDDGIWKLDYLYEAYDTEPIQEIINKARKFVEQRTWANSANILEKTLLELVEKNE